MEIEVCVVAGRRPDLLRRTLESFDRSMFSNFNVVRALVNIDPIFGDETDHRECVAIVQSTFSNATIFEPPEAGFCRAVKRVWGASEADIIFHLEDDWILNRQLRPQDIQPLFDDPRTKQIQLNNADKNWNVVTRGHFNYVRARSPQFLGISLKPRFPLFSTSPSFISGEFARTGATLLKSEFDPEKQFYHRVNPPLEEFVRPFRARVFGNKPDFPITDIGREWRNARNIEKRVLNGNSVWTKQGGEA